MSIIGNEALAGASGQAGYFIDRSLRFRSSAGAYLSRTPSVSGNRKTFTISFWCKLGKLNTSQRLFSTTAGASQFYFRFDSNNRFSIEQSTVVLLQSKEYIRDIGAWYHFVVRIDTTQANANDRVRVYKNGVKVAYYQTGTAPSQNADLQWNQGGIGHYISGHGSGEYFDGVVTEVHSIDGQSLDASYFGETDLDTGVWKPIEYTGSYGTNGFYLNFKNPATTVTLCADQSGNGNNWGANNISLSAGSTYDSMQDVPTLTSEDAGNYATLNPLSASAGGLTFSNGNLTVTPTVFRKNCKASITLPNTGKYYWEWTFNSTTGASAIYNPSIAPITSTADSSLEGAGLYAFWVYTSSSLYVKYNNTLVRPTQAVTWSTSDVMQFAVDMDTRRVWLGKNNAWFDTSTGTTGNPSAGTNYLATLSSDYDYAPSVAGETTGITSNVNFGQRPFTYTPPTGYKALNTYNLPDPTIADGEDYFNAVTYTGDGASNHAVTGIGFQPDFVWLKNRNSAQNYSSYDVIRGATKILYSNLINAESTDLNSLKSFDSDGFTVGSTSAVNSGGDAFISWNWKANGSGVSNTDGSITSTVSANTSSGFSVVTYTGTGANTTVGHGLGIAPSMVIYKKRNAAYDGCVYHSALGPTQRMILFAVDPGIGVATDSLFFNNTAPTSTTLSLGTRDHLNGSSQTYVAWCFAPVEGFSAFGSYAGNSSSDGPFVYCGFKPRWIMIRSTSALREWNCWDTARNLYNGEGIGGQLNLGNNHAEYAYSNYNDVIDFVSNGFKLRSGWSNNYNQGETYIYAAFAENPFKYSLAR